MDNKSPQFYVPSPKMNQHELLKHISGNPHITQAELARRCGLSVAMVNNYMKELEQAGMLEFERRSMKDVSYYLTADGQMQYEVVEKELICHLASEYDRIKHRVCDYIISQSKGALHRVVLLGHGSMTGLVQHALESAHIEVLGCCQNGETHPTEKSHGMWAIEPYELDFLAPDAIIVVDPPNESKILNTLPQMLASNTEIITLYMAKTDKWRQPVLAPV
jgi:DNA-binding MarR family transcriptional regulator